MRTYVLFLNFWCQVVWLFQRFYFAAKVFLKCLLRLIRTALLQGDGRSCIGIALHPELRQEHSLGKEILNKPMQMRISLIGKVFSTYLPYFLF